LFVVGLERGDEGFADGVVDVAALAFGLIFEGDDVGRGAGLSQSGFEMGVAGAELLQLVLGGARFFDRGVLGCARPRASVRRYFVVFHLRRSGWRKRDNRLPIKARQLRVCTDFAIAWTLSPLRTLIADNT